MINFKIDKEKCIKCGLCSSECPVLIINGKTEFPEIKDGKEDLCIKCQHCLAVCPSAALSIWGKNPKDSILVNDQIPSGTDMERLIKTRRSVRKFKSEAVSKDLIDNLIETAAYAPTAHNKNAVLFTVCDEKTELSKVRDMVYSIIKKAKEENQLPTEMNFLSDLQRLWNSKQIDVLFRDAPHLLITSAPATLHSPETDAHIAMTYFELLANSYGIGTLWNGFLKMILDGLAPELKTQLGIPEDHVIGYIMIFGKPAIKFARSIQNDGPKPNRISL